MFAITFGGVLLAVLHGFLQEMS